MISICISHQVQFSSSEIIKINSLIRTILLVYLRSIPCINKTVNYLLDLLMLTASNLILLQTVTVCDKYIWDIRRLFAWSGVQHRLCCVFALFSFIFLVLFDCSFDILWRLYTADSITVTFLSQTNAICSVFVYVNSE